MKKKGRKPIDPEIRFWNKVAMIPFSTCWYWTGARSRVYGSFGINKWNTPSAHRFSWEIAYGPIPSGLDVCHKCDTPLCVRPDHLFLGTHAENMKDMSDKKRQRGPKGISHHNAKLSEDDIGEIRHLISQGIKQKDVASRFGVGQAVISEIHTRKTWKHV